MPPERGDPARLVDMVEAAGAVGRFIAGKTRADYDADELLRSAVERQIEIIGEAARFVSKALRDQHPEVPWHKIMGTRHVLAHDYDRVNPDTVWRIATVYVPDVIVLVRPLIPPFPPDPEPQDG